MTGARWHRLRRAAAACALGLVCASVGGCGQKGPLTLPDSARPIETLPATTGDGAGGASSTEQSTDENEKKERTENER